MKDAQNAHRPAQPAPDFSEQLLNEGPVEFAVPAAECPNELIFAVDFGTPDPPKPLTEHQRQAAAFTKALAAYVKP